MFALILVYSIEIIINIYKEHVGIVVDTIFVIEYDTLPVEKNVNKHWLLHLCHIDMTELFIKGFF